MSAPIIGITMYGPEPKPGEPIPFVSLPVAYVDAIARAGGLPVLLGSSGTVPIDATLDALDGLVLAGGGDMDPGVWGGDDHATVYGVIGERDSFEMAITCAAIARTDVPILGICRGLQVLNVVAGGDLVAHVPDAFGEQVLHRVPPHGQIEHRVTVEPGNLLAELCGEASFPVCSWHHQAAGTIAGGFRAVAHAEDGCVEAMVHEEHPFCLAVQWHPELQVPDDAVQARLFEEFVAAARVRRSAD